MQYRRLGTTDVQVSVVGLGTMTWGTQNTQAEAFEQMDYALAQGVNFFDTAEMYAVPPTADTYGKTETIIGNWFKARGNRDQVVLASKIAGPGLKWIRNGNNRIDRANIQQALEASLQRLQTDYIDLYQLHWPNRGSYHFGQIWKYAPDFDPAAEEANFIEVLQCLQELITAGKIRHLGLSNETAWGTLKWLSLSRRDSLPRMVSIQNEYSLLCRHFEPDLSEIALHEDIGLLAWSPLAQGMLSGKYLDGAAPLGARLTLDKRAVKLHRNHPNTEATIQRYVDLAQANGLDPCQMALAFVHARPFTTSTLIGATTMQQLASNIESIDLDLSDEVLAGIAQIRRDYPMPF